MHNSTAWEQTDLAQHHNKLLEDREWVWADSAYPVGSIEKIYMLLLILL